VETQKWADVRIPLLLRTPAAVRFLSCEPLLAPVDLLGRHTVPVLRSSSDSGVELDAGYLRAIDWVIAGGESGPGARPMHPDWVRNLRDQCIAAAVPFFFKQWGAWIPTAPAEPDARGPRVLVDPRGGIHSLRGLQLAPTGSQLVRRAGKKASGRELDERTWDEMPSPEPIPARA
jgi:protein gp37